MSWLWLALVDGPPPGDPIACAEVRDDRWIAVWPPETRPPVPAAKVDARLVQPGAGPALVSLVLAPPRVRLPFDDPAVAGARRRVLAGPPRRAVSTLVRGDSIFAGAVTVGEEGDVVLARDDPFGRIFPARLLAVGAGLFGAVPAPAGPVIERYGGGNPWPWDRFTS